MENQQQSLTEVSAVNAVLGLVLLNMVSFTLDRFVQVFSYHILQIDHDSVWGAFILTIVAIYILIYALDKLPLTRGTLGRVGDRNGDGTIDQADVDLANGVIEEERKCENRWCKKHACKKCHKSEKRCCC